MRALCVCAWDAGALNGLIQLPFDGLEEQVLVPLKACDRNVAPAIHAAVHVTWSCPIHRVIVAILPMQSTTVFSSCHRLMCIASTVP